MSFCPGPSGSPFNMASHPTHWRLWQIRTANFNLRLSLGVGGSGAAWVWTGVRPPRPLRRSVFGSRLKPELDCKWHQIGSVWDPGWGAVSSHDWTILESETGRLPATGLQSCREIRRRHTQAFTGSTFNLAGWLSLLQQFGRIRKSFIVFNAIRGFGKKKKKSGQN